MRAVLLMGGNGAGKTTTMDRARDQLRAEWEDSPGVGSMGLVWIHGDTELNGSLIEQAKGLMRVWGDSAVSTVVIEGVRIYSTVFRCAVAARPRPIAIASLLQSYEVGCVHLRQRCERRGKTYRQDFWEKGSDDKTQRLFNTRYERAARAFLRDRPDLVLDLQEFWISEDYRELPAVEAWIVKWVTEGAHG